MLNSIPNDVILNNKEYQGAKQRPEWRHFFVAMNIRRGLMLNSIQKDVILLLNSIQNDVILRSNQ